MVSRIAAEPNTAVIEELRRKLDFGTKWSISSDTLDESPRVLWKPLFSRLEQLRPSEINPSTLPQQVLEIEEICDRILNTKHFTKNQLGTVRSSIGYSLKFMKQAQASNPQCLNRPWLHSLRQRLQSEGITLRNLDILLGLRKEVLPPDYNPAANRKTRRAALRLEYNADRSSS